MNIYIKNISLYIHFEDVQKNISKLTIDKKNNKEESRREKNPLKIAQNNIFVDVKWTTMMINTWKEKTNKQQYLRILKNDDEG